MGFSLKRRRLNKHVIPDSLEAKVEGSEFKASSGYIVKLSLKIKIKNKS